MASQNVSLYESESPQPNGKLIITGGTKANQKKDESSFRKLKKDYLNAIK